MCCYYGRFLLGTHSLRFTEEPRLFSLPQSQLLKSVVRLPALRVSRDCFSLFSGKDGSPSPFPPPKETGDHPRLLPAKRISPMAEVLCSLFPLCGYKEFRSPKPRRSPTDEPFHAPIETKAPLFPFRTPFSLFRASFRSTILSCWTPSLAKFMPSSPS